MAAEPLREYPGASFVQAEFNDGDSFQVRFDRNGQLETHVVRLYFIDAFESIADSKTRKQTLLDQTRYFEFAGPNRPKGIEYGEKAASRVSELLSEPFTVHTSFAMSRGSSRKPRILAMITTAKGDDLAAVLVREGLARITKGVRKRPDGTSGENYREELLDLEKKAKAQKIGAWVYSDPTQRAKIDEERQREERELEEVVPSSRKKSARPKT